MRKKIEITPEMIKAYEGLLDKRVAAARAEIAKQEKHLKRIESKRIDLERSLRAELSEKSLGVLHALGLPAPSKRERQANKEADFREQEKKSLETEPEKKEVETKTKSGWEW